MSTRSYPGPQRRRPIGIRRPRVAGRVPGRVGPADGPLATPATPAPPRALEPPAEVDRPTVDDATAGAVTDDHAGAPDAGAVAASGTGQARAEATGDAAGRRRARPSGKRLLRARPADARPAARRPRGPVPIPALAAALALLVGLAVFFGVENAALRGTASAQNTALVDIGTTAQVSQQATDALKTIYSFDYTRLDQNEGAARAVITPDFAAQFDRLFQQVRQLAPQQQAVVTATVNVSGVESINGDTATLLVFLDQQATRAQAGDAPQQLAAAGRLTVTARLVDGAWKIADVQPR